MSGRRATLVTILGVILAACSSGAAPTPSDRASPDPSQSALAGNRDADTDTDTDGASRHHDPDGHTDANT